MLPQDGGQRLPGNAARQRSFGLALERGGVPEIAVEELPDFAVVVKIIVHQARKMREPLRRDATPQRFPAEIRLAKIRNAPGTPAGSCRNQAYAV